MDTYEPEKTKEKPKRYEPVTNRNGETETETYTDNKKGSGKYTNEIKEILSYLNKKTGRNWKKSGDLKKRLLKFSVDDIKKVIDFKCKDDFFKNDNYKFMQPSTIFRKSNFDKYHDDLNSIVRKENEYGAERPKLSILEMVHKGSTDKEMIDAGFEQMYIDNARKALNGIIK